MFALLLSLSLATADEWESQVNGEKAYNEVQALLAYKKSQAAEVEEIFYGLRDSLYIVEPSSKTTYSNNFLTPSTVAYTVKVSAKFNSSSVNALSSAIKNAGYLRKGENKVTFKFPNGDVSLHLYDEIYPIYINLIKGGYAFEARAVLLDNEQTVLATSDNSLLLSVPSVLDGLNFTGKPLLQSYVKAEAPDLTAILGNHDAESKDNAYAELYSFFSEPAYRLVDSQTAQFYSLPVEKLKDVSSCRVLRESDELLVYKRDAQ